MAILLESDCIVFLNLNRTAEKFTMYQGSNPLYTLVYCHLRSFNSDITFRFSFDNKQFGLHANASKPQLPFGNLQFTHIVHISKKCN